MLLGFMERKITGSMIFITHDLSVLYQIADRIMILYAGKVVEIGPTEEIVKNPVHPYTKALLYSLPEMNVRFKEKKLQGIPGHPPHLLNPPPGCRFHDRCPLAKDKCEEKEPPLVEVGEDHIVYCWEVVA
jgi:peptide/nickel transport system ATP-binding protein